MPGWLRPFPIRPFSFPIAAFSFPIGRVSFPIRAFSFPIASGFGGWPNRSTCLIYYILRFYTPPNTAFSFPIVGLGA